MFPRLLGPSPPDKNFLGHRSDQLPVAVEDRAEGKTASLRRDRAALDVEQPLVGARWAVKPDGMIEARRVERLTGPKLQVRADADMN